MGLTKRATLVSLLVGLSGNNRQHMCFAWTEMSPLLEVRRGWRWLNDVERVRCDWSQNGSGPISVMTMMI